MNRTVFVAVLAYGLTVPLVAEAYAVGGTVYADNDDNGVLSAGDTPLPGVVVYWETTVTTVTDAQGRFSLNAPTNGMVWVRTPSGFEPNPTWQVVSGATSTADLGLRPTQTALPVRFVHASDTHIGNLPESLDGGANIVNAKEARLALEQVSRAEPTPHFLVITGDITQWSSVKSFDQMTTALQGLSIPFVPVAGNHDSKDGGSNWRSYFGPPNYSFDVGDVHFIVFDYIGATQAAGVIDFLQRDIAFNTPGQKLVVFTHAPPAMPQDRQFLDALITAGVDYLFTGHWHSNRVQQRGPILEFNTQPFVMGGIDMTPAGYRMVTMDGDALAVTHHTVVEQAVFNVVSPLADACISQPSFDIVAAVESESRNITVTASLDGGPAVTLQRMGGWAYAANLDVDAPGQHSLAVTLSGPRVPADTIVVPFCYKPLTDPPTTLVDWAQHQRTSGHHGFLETRLTPPLHQGWARAVGGHVRGGSPVLADNRLFVPVADFGDSSEGGVAVFDALTGEPLWRHTTGSSVHNSPAVWQNTVIFASSDGVLHAHDTATGTERWVLNMGENLATQNTWMYAAPTVEEGIAYVGLQRRFMAVDIETGVPLWEVDPSPQGGWLGSFSAAGFSQGVVMAAFSRGVDGLVAYDAYTGAPLWTLPRPQATAVNSALVTDGDMLFFGNVRTVAYGVDLISADTRWQTGLHPGSHDWSYGIMGTPAFAHSRLVVPTQFTDLVGLDAQTGAELWRHASGTSVIHPVHYKVAVQGFSSSAIVTGDIVWAGGADGVLYAVDLVDGSAVWNIDLGAPIMSGPIASGRMLFVATWDGTVRSLVSDIDPFIPPPPQPPESGCGCSVTRPHRSSSSTLVLVVALGVVAMWGRRQRQLDSR